jgi:hypothetical protein
MTRLDLPDDLANALIAAGVGCAVDDVLGEDVPAAPADQWLDVAGAAALIGCHPERLRKHRREGGGPQFERFGQRKRFVRYRRGDVLTWAARNPGRFSGRDNIDDGGNDP